MLIDGEQRIRDGATFDLAINSKLRGSGLLQTKIADYVNRPDVWTRVAITKCECRLPVRLEIAPVARAWLWHRGGSLEEYVFPSWSDHSRI